MGLTQRLHFLSAILAPLNLSLKTGHLLSSLKSRAVDRSGRALPWYTYPAVEYLSQLDFSDAEVLEFGGGQSTEWWCARAKSVVCLESNKVWSARLAQRLGGRATVLTVSSPAKAAELVGERKFDVIVVDDGSGVGPDGRVDNARTAFSHLSPGGLVIVDNADANYAGPIAAIAHQANWNRIDFIGFSPGSSGQSCTSLFFADASRRLRPGAQPRIVLYG
ncbi:MAG: hypothetical protein WCC14_01130 [Acidobacteriaceae bacterium]